MPVLNVPLNIWLSSTPDERDAFYLQAGFDPNLPVVDAGTDTQTVRFMQDEPGAAIAVAPETVVPFVPQSGEYHEGGPPYNYIPHPDEHPRHSSPGLKAWEAAQVPQAGDDLRDFQAQPVSITTDEFGVAAEPAPAGGAAIITVTALATRLPGPLRTQFLNWLRTSGAIVGGRIGWASLPSWLRSALVLVGISGATIVVDTMLEGGVDIQIGPPQANPLQSAQVVGSWVANGVRFYRLVDGKIAVQNKKGRWKVWRPKKPIVLYANGASNLKTMLRADKALNKQAKQIAAMLNRRAPRTRKTTRNANPSVIAVQGGKVIDQG